MHGLVNLNTTQFYRIKPSGMLHPVDWLHPVDQLHPGDWLHHGEWLHPGDWRLTYRRLVESHYSRSSSPRLSWIAWKLDTEDEGITILRKVDKYLAADTI